MSNTIFCLDLIRKGNMSLDYWLELMNSDRRDEMFPNNCFPSIEFLNEYIAKIETVSENEFKNLLRKLLVNTGSYGVDELNEQFLAEKNFKEYPDEYSRRILERRYAYEGLSWILDLLPYFLKKALEVIDAFYIVHFRTLPDAAVDGLSDSQVLIRARYLQNNYSVENILNLKPREFEYLIAKLYQKLGYEVEVTKATRDGGKDVFATSRTVGRREKLYIDCKRYKANVGITHARSLFGIVTNDKITKDVLIGAKGFSKSTKKFVEQNSSIELIGGTELLGLLDNNLGKNWFDFIPKYINELEQINQKN